MNIVIDLSDLISAAYSQNPFIMGWVIFKSGGWIIYLGLFGWMFKLWWLNHRRNLYFAKQQYIFLAIDIPKENEQTPKAVESAFATFSGARTSPNLIDKWWHGKFQLPFSLELASLEGYIQFIIWTPKKYRDLVESAFYSQYPDADITEVEDYTKNFPNEFPNKDYELYGTEFKLENDYVYPINTYPNFEHGLSQKLIDPMAALLEVLSKLRPGEQVWLQLVIRPVDDKWKEKAIKAAKKLIHAKAEEKKRLHQQVIGTTITPVFSTVAEILLKGANIITGEEKKVEKKDLPSQVQYLSPGEVLVVKAVQEKLSKIGFKTKFRFIYLAKHEVFETARGRDPIFGAINQFTRQEINGFKKAKRTATHINYFLINRRENLRRGKIIRAYKKRSFTKGSKEFILNIEELASLYHFPTLDVKAPLVKKVESKRVEPPFALPVERELPRVTAAPVSEVPTGESASTVQPTVNRQKVAVSGEKTAGPPGNLPL